MIRPAPEDAIHLQKGTFMNPTSYFWKEIHDLPAGIGFGLFSSRHFAAVLCCGFGVAFALGLFLKCSKKRQDVLLKATALSLLAGNLLRDLFLFSVHRMSLAYLPLHLCSFAIFVYLLQAFLPERFLPFRRVLGEIGLVLLMPGTICALIFPDWTAYPLWNFMCIHSFVWHAVLVFYPLALFLSGRLHPTIRHLWYPVLYLGIIVPPTAVFNHFTGCNYLFIMIPLKGTPLELLYSLMGAYWRIGYALLVLAVILLVYLILGTLHRRFRNVVSDGPA